MTTQTVAEREEELRDLRSQVAGLSRDDEREMIFKETSPPLRFETVYSMENGEAVQIPRYMLANVLDKRRPRQDGGGYMFTADRGKAPTFRPGTVKCFMHPDAPEHDILFEIGIQKTCPAASLANSQSRRIHGMHRHKDEWAAYQEYLNERREEQAQERADKQLEATLAIARIAAAPRVEAKGTEWLDGIQQVDMKPSAEAIVGLTEKGILPAPETCACGYVTKEGKDPAASMRMHKRLHCPLTRPEGPND